MAIRHVMAALSAAFLPLASSAADTVGADAPVVSIQAGQYDRFISGASFVDRPDVWTNANETWSASGGLSPRYWSGLEGVTLLPVYGSYEGPELDRMDATHTACTFDRWSRRGQQPAVYGEIDGEGHYRSLYWDGSVASVRVVDVDRPACAPASCRLSADGPVAPEDGGDVFLDAQVAFEPFAYGEANRPTDVVAPDASLALYMQDTRPDGSPHLFVVARDWDTGVIRHFDTGGSYLELNHEYQAGGGADRYCGRVVVRAMRTVHAGKFDPVVPAFMVYINRGYDYVSYNGTTGTIQWDKLRDDLGLASWHGTSHSPFFRPLSATPSLSLSRVSFGGGLTLGAYAVSRADPLRTTVRWTANSGMVTQLYADGHAISDIDAGAWSMYRTLLGSYDLQRYPLDIAWAGVNGWSDGRFESRPGGGCDVSLGPDCFPKGCASLSTMPADDEEEAEELEQSLPARTGERIGNRYMKLSDALAHASVLGGTVRLLAYPASALVITQLVQDVVLDLADHDVPYSDWYAAVLGLFPSGGLGQAALRGEVNGDVVVSSAPGSSPRLTLLNSGADIGQPYLYGGRLYVTNAAFSADGVAFYGSSHPEESKSHVCDSPSVVLEDVYFSSFGLVSEGSALSLNNVYMQDSDYDGFADTNTLLEVYGGSLDARELDMRGGVRVTAADFVRIAHSTDYRQLCAVDILSCTNVTLRDFYTYHPVVLSNSLDVAVQDVRAKSGLWVVDTDRACITGGVSVTGGLRLYRSAVDIAPGVAIDSLAAYDVPVALTNMSISALVVSNDTGSAVLSGVVQTASPTELHAPEVEVTGSTFAATTFDRCETVTVSNSTFAATAFNQCGTVSLLASALAAVTLDRCDTAVLGVSTGQRSTASGTGLSIVQGANLSAGIDADACAVVASGGHCGGVSLHGGSLTATGQASLGNVVTSNSVVAVSGGSFGTFAAVDAVSVDISGGSFSGMFAVTSSAPATISGGPQFSRGVTVVSPGTVVSGGVFSRYGLVLSAPADDGSPAGTVAGGVFEVYPVFETFEYIDSTGAHVAKDTGLHYVPYMGTVYGTVTVSGGRFNKPDTYVSYYAGKYTELQLPDGYVLAPGKAILSTAEYWEVVDK